MRYLPPGTPVAIRRPRALRRETGTVLRAVSGGYEVGFTRATGRPEHAVLHPRWLRRLDKGEGEDHRRDDRGPAA
jgi:hypothetical protein